MSLADAANWVLILTGVIGGVVLLVGFIWWMSAMHHGTKQTAKECRSIRRWVRRKDRKSEVFHNEINVKVHNHENRICSLEAGGTHYGE